MWHNFDHSDSDLIADYVSYVADYARASHWDYNFWSCETFRPTD